jgi:hypothetical protein
MKFVTTWQEICYLRHDTKFVTYDLTWNLLLTTWHEICYLRHDIKFFTYDMTGNLLLTTWHEICYLRHDMKFVTYDMTWNLLLATWHEICYLRHDMKFVAYDMTWNFLPLYNICINNCSYVRVHNADWVCYCWMRACDSLIPFCWDSSGWANVKRKGKACMSTERGDKWRGGG